MDQNAVTHHLTYEIVFGKRVAHLCAIVEQNTIVPRLLELGPRLVVLCSGHCEELRQGDCSSFSKHLHKVLVVGGQHTLAFATPCPTLCQIGALHGGEEVRRVKKS